MLEVFKSVKKYLTIKKTHQRKARKQASPWTA